MREPSSRSRRAYIAPEAVPVPVVYSGYVDADEYPFEFSPRFSTLVDAVAWARERVDWVIARDVDTEYFWYGVGPAPSGVTPPTGN